MYVVHYWNPAKAGDGGCATNTLMAMHSFVPVLTSHALFWIVFMELYSYTL